MSTPQALPAAFKSQPFWLSQAGAARTDDGMRAGQSFLPPALKGQIVKLVVVAKSAARLRVEHDVTSDGMIIPASAARLGHVPFAIRLVAKDGSEYTANVDVRPSVVGSSGAGYLRVDALNFQRVLPDTLDLGPMLLSQSGAVMPHGEWPHYTPIVPGFEGRFAVLEVTAPGGRTAKFNVDDAGRVQPDSRQPALNAAGRFRVTLLTADGQRFSSNVDVSPKATGRSGAGYYTVNLRVAREGDAQPLPPISSASVVAARLPSSPALAATADTCGLGLRALAER